MKLRIKGNSIRLRVTRSEVSRLIDEGRIQETVYFGVTDDAKLTYALEHSTSIASPQLARRPQEIAILLPSSTALPWANAEEVGIYAKVDVGSHGVLELVVEKDFACLDLSDAENADTFPNPQAGVLC